jgi:hypothetical protein
LPQYHDDGLRIVQHCKGGSCTKQAALLFRDSLQ